MFHVDNNLFFGRHANGSVRILKLSTTPTDFPVMGKEYPNTVYDITLTKGIWCSIVVSMSHLGEVNDRFYDALKFHTEE